MGAVGVPAAVEDDLVTVELLHLYDVVHVGLHGLNNIRAVGDNVGDDVLALAADVVLQNDAVILLHGFGEAALEGDDERIVQLAAEEKALGGADIIAVNDDVGVIMLHDFVEHLDFKVGVIVEEVQHRLGLFQHGDESLAGAEEGLQAVEVAVHHVGAEHFVLAVVGGQVTCRSASPVHGIHVGESDKITPMGHIVHIGDDVEAGVGDSACGGVGLHNPFCTEEVGATLEGEAVGLVAGGAEKLHGGEVLRNPLGNLAAAPITLMMFCDLSLGDCPSVNAKGIVLFISIVILFI